MRKLLIIALAVLGIVLTNCSILGSQAISNLDDVNLATFRVETEGTFAHLGEGLSINEAGSGSGFIINPSGIAVTNNHVVTGAAYIEVWLEGENEPRSARVLGVSECSDLAILQIDGEDLPYLKWSSADLKVGTEVFSAGFPLGDPEYTLTSGIISKANADGNTPWSSSAHVFEHNATLNPGNSGGPLVDQDGSVLGVNYASSVMAVNQNYAIDGSYVQSILDDLVDGHDIDSIGMNSEAFYYYDDETEEEYFGIWVSSVDSGSSASELGLLPGDIILSIENLEIAYDGTLADYCKILRSSSPGEVLSFEVYRSDIDTVLELVGEINDSPILASNDEQSEAGVVITEPIPVQITEPPSEIINVTSTPSIPAEGLDGNLTACHISNAYFEQVNYILESLFRTADVLSTVNQLVPKIDSSGRIYTPGLENYTFNEVHYWTTEFRNLIPPPDITEAHNSLADLLETFVNAVARDQEIRGKTPTPCPLWGTPAPAETRELLCQMRSGGWGNTYTSLQLQNALSSLLERNEVCAK